MDIDRLAGEAIASRGARDQTIRMMKLMNAQAGTRLAPYELFSAGNGRYDSGVDRYSMKSGRVMPGFTQRYVGNHTDHIHLAY